MDGSSGAIVDVGHLRLDWLVRHLVANRFLPAPPPDLTDVGDGDFRAIGAEFLRHFVRIGGLRSTDRVVDLGCGIGRMAVPLTQFLDEAGEGYDGFDVVKPAIAWCTDAITARYPSFRFGHLDLHHPIYNPAGTMRTEDVRLPMADGSVDFAILTSLMTHLHAGEVRAYVRELARILRPGGRSFVTFFLIDEVARGLMAEGRARFRFDVSGAGPEYHVSADTPTSAVAYDEGFVRSVFAEAGLAPLRPTLHGHWSGRVAEPFQDICLFGKAA